MKYTVNALRNLAKTTFVRDTGAVNSNWSVFRRNSSEKVFIVRIGTRRI